MLWEKLNKDNYYNKMKNRFINTKIFGDPYIRKLEKDEKLLFIYFLINHLTNICGMYEIDKDQMAFDIKLKEEEISQIIEKFEKDKKIIYIDNWICIINFIKNQSLNPSVITGIEREIQLVPEDIRKKFITACKSLKQDGTVDIAPDKSGKKAYWDGYPMRYKQSEKQWYVIKDNEKWCKFVGNKKDIVWK